MDQLAVDTNFVARPLLPPTDRSPERSPSRRRSRSAPRGHLLREDGTSLIAALQHENPNAPSIRSARRASVAMRLSQLSSNLENACMGSQAHQFHDLMAAVIPEIQFGPAGKRQSVESLNELGTRSRGSLTYVERGFSNELHRSVRENAAGTSFLEDLCRSSFSASLPSLASFGTIRETSRLSEDLTPEQMKFYAKYIHDEDEVEASHPSPPVSSTLTYGTAFLHGLETIVAEREPSRSPLNGVDSRVGVSPIKRASKSLLFQEKRRSLFHADDDDVWDLFGSEIAYTTGPLVYQIDRAPIALNPEDSEYGVRWQLYSCCCYVMVHTTNEEERAVKANQVTRTVFQWVGPNAPLNSVARSAMYSLILREYFGNDTRIVRIEGFNETSIFLESMEYPVDIVKDTGSRSSPLSRPEHEDEKAAPKLFQWVQSDPRRLCMALPAVSTILENPCSSFILDAGRDVYVIRGSQTPRREFLCCCLVAESIVNVQRPGKARVCILEGHDLNSLQKILQANGKDLVDYSRTFAILQIWAPRAIVHAPMSKDSNSMEMSYDAADIVLPESKSNSSIADSFVSTESTDGVQQTSLQCLFDWSAPETLGILPSRRLLSSDSCYFIDIGTEVYIWRGRSTPSERQEMTTHYLRTVLRAHPRPPWTSVQQCLQDDEPMSLRYRFKDWLLDAIPRPWFAGIPVPPSLQTLNERDMFLLSDTTPSPLHLSSSQARAILDLADSALAKLSIFKLNSKGKCEPVPPQQLSPITRLEASTAYVFLAIYRSGGVSDDHSVYSDTDQVDDSMSEQRAIFYLWKGQFSPKTAFPLFSMRTWPSLMDAMKSSGCSHVEIVHVQPLREPLHILAHLNRMLLVEGLRPSPPQRPWTLPLESSAGSPQGESSSTLANDRLFHLRIRHHHCCIGAEVPFEASRLVSRDAFLVLLGASDVLLWLGKGVSRVKEQPLLERFAREFTEANDDVSLRIVHESSSAEKEMLGHFPPFNSKLRRGTGTGYHYMPTPRFLRCSYQQGPLTESDKNTSSQQQRQGKYAVSRGLDCESGSDWHFDDPGVCILLDAGDADPLYLWIGALATPAIRKFAIESATYFLMRPGDRRSGLLDVKLDFEDVWRTPHTECRTTLETPPSPTSPASHALINSLRAMGASELSYTLRWRLTAASDAECAGSFGKLFKPQSETSLASLRANCSDIRTQSRSTKRRAVCVEHQGHESVQFKSYFFAWRDTDVTSLL